MCKDGRPRGRPIGAFAHVRISLSRQRSVLVIDIIVRNGTRACTAHGGGSGRYTGATITPRWATTCARRTIHIFPRLGGRVSCPLVSHLFVSHLLLLLLLLLPSLARLTRKREISVAEATIGEAGSCLAEHVVESSRTASGTRRRDYAAVSANTDRSDEEISRCVSRWANVDVDVDVSRTLVFLL